MFENIKISTSRQTTHGKKLVSKWFSYIDATSDW
jgi:hypothetical protein